MTKRELLEEIAEQEGLSVGDIIWTTDSVVLGICPDCLEVVSVEPDQEAGFCDECGKNTVISSQVLAGVI